MAVDLGELEQHFGLPPGLLAAVQQQESGGNPNAVSPSGALGAYQFMPATAQQYGIDPLNPDQAAQGAAHMYGDLLTKYNGDLPSALAAYNWGQGNVDRKGLQNAPPETQNYIQKIMGTIGNAIIPQAQAAETSQQSSNPYDGLTDEQLLAEANKQGIVQSKSDPAGLGSMPWGNVPEDQKVEKTAVSSLLSDEVKADVAREDNPQASAVADKQTPSDNPYDNLSNEQLIAEASKQGIKTQLPTGTDAYMPELKQAASTATDEMKSGYENVKKGLSPLGMMAEMMTGTVTPEMAKDFADNSQSSIPGSNIIQGIGQTALGALNLAQSPLTAANKSFVGNPLENATGIPSWATDLALSIPEFGAGSKAIGALSKLAPAADLAQDDLALNKMTSPSMPQEQPYNITNAQGVQAKPSDTVVGFADKQPQYNAGPGPGFPETQTAVAAPKVNPWTGEPLEPSAPITAATQRALATQAFKEADARGGFMSPEFSNKVMNDFDSSLTESPRVTAALGRNPAQKMAADLSEEFSNKPMSLNDATSIYKRLGDAMDGDVNPLTGKLGAQGQQFFAMQTQLRNAMEEAAQNGHVLGGPEGIQAWQRGNALWAQSARLADIERIIQRAEGAANETLVRQNGFRALANNPKRLRGYTPEEVAAIKDAAKTGTATNLLRVFGSRLLPIGATILGESAGGPLGAIVGGGISHAISTGARAGMDILESGKHQKVLETIGKRKIP